MNSCCINLKLKQKHYKRYFYCCKANKDIDIDCCKNCPFKEYKRNKVKKDYNKNSIFDVTSFEFSSNPNDGLREITVFNFKILGYEKHHIFGGSDRGLSEKYGLFCWISKNDHKYLTAHPLSNERLQKRAQKEFEKIYGHDMFVSLFHPKYLIRKNQKIW